MPPRRPVPHSSAPDLPGTSEQDSSAGPWPVAGSSSFHPRPSTTPAMSHSNSPLTARQPGLALAAALLAAALAGCGSGSAATGGAGSAAPAPASETSHSAAAGGQAPVPAESNPPGDIPDTTVYVTYQP